MAKSSSIATLFPKYLEDTFGISLPKDMDWRGLRLHGSIFVFYFLTGYFGLQLNSFNTFATLVWPPSGIAFAAFLLFGFRVWPGVFFGAFFVNIFIGAPFAVAGMIAIGNTIGPFFGTVLAKWYSNYNFEILRLRDNIGIIGSAFIFPVLTATIGVGSLWLAHLVSTDAFSTTWSTWWMGDMLGAIVCAPFILKWFSRPLFSRTPLEYVEFTVSTLSVALFAFLIFSYSFTPFAYGLFIPLTWVALRNGPRGITLSLLLASIIAIGGTVLGHGPFAEVGLLHLQIYLAAMCTVFLIFTAVVAERKRVYKTLEQHVTELEIALNRISSEDEAKKEFLAVLAHELRNPLATILSSIELIHLQGIGAPNTNMLIDNVADRARAMVHLLDDLLDISRISQKKMSIEKQTVAVQGFIDKLIITTQPLIAKYGHTFSIKRPHEELYLEADPVRLEQIFTNLIVNASKYTKPPGSIDIFVERDRDFLITRIRDSGIGIPRNMLRRIFEPFFQIKRDETSREGMGIGLPLTRQLVEMHGGTIEAWSEGAGSGSEFIVRLPLMVGEQTRLTLPPISMERRRSPRKSKRPLKILVVDDNQEAVDTLQQMLELRGHTIETAYNGADAIKKASRFRPDAAFVDIGMPDMDGYEVARRLRHHKHHYELIALTGYGQPEDVQNAKEAGFDYHLTKPASFAEIENVLRKVKRTLETKKS